MKQTYAYMEVYEDIKKQILKKAYPYGSKLPGKRMLKEQYNVSNVTIEHALDLLKEEGYIVSKPRSGTHVSYIENTVFDALPTNTTIKAPTFEIQSLERPPFPFSSLAKAMRKVITDYDESLYQQSPSNGLLSLRQAIKSYLLRSRNIDVSTDQIIISSGAVDMYSRIVLLLGTNKSYGYEQPSYEKIKQTYNTYNVKAIPLPMGKNGIQSIALKQHNVDVLHVTPYHSYPSLVTANISKRKEYINYATLHNAYIIEDDYDSEFSLLSKSEETLFNLSTNDNVIYLNSFTSTIAPSIRMSYMILPKHLVQTYNDKLSYINCPVSTYFQYVLTELLNNGQFERHLNRVRRHLRNQI